MRQQWLFVAELKRHAIRMRQVHLNHAALKARDLEAERRDPALVSAWSWQEVRYEQWKAKVCRLALLELRRISPEKQMIPQEYWDRIRERCHAKVFGKHLG